MLFYYLCLLISIVAGAAGQIILKMGALNQVKTGTPIYADIYSLVGFSVYFLAAVCYVYSLRRIPLSIAFPSVSLSYFFVSLAAHFLLGESFTSANLIGLILISLGIYVISFS